MAALVDEIEAAGAQAGFRVSDVMRREDLDALVSSPVSVSASWTRWPTTPASGPISTFDALRVDDQDAMVDVNLARLLGSHRLGA
jgi:hypothetical protein